MKKVLVALALGLLASLCVWGAAAAQEEPLPDLVVTKTGPATSLVGERAVYDVTVTNAGDATAVFPAGATYCKEETRLIGYRRGWETAIGCDAHFPGASPSQVGTFERPATYIALLNTNTGFSVAPGESSIRTSDNYVLPANPGWIENCATVDPDNVVAESNEENNTSCVTTKVVPAR